MVLEHFRIGMYYYEISQFKAAKSNYFEILQKWQKYQFLYGDFLSGLFGDSPMQYGRVLRQKLGGAAIHLDITGEL